MPRFIQFVFLWAMLWNSTVLFAQTVFPIVNAELQSAQGTRAVTLPHQVESADFFASGARLHYSMTLPLDEVPATRLGIYVQKMSLAGRVFLNGIEVGSCELGALEVVRCINRPYLFVPPIEYWRLGDNLIQFEIHTNSKEINGLSVVRVADAQWLESEYYKPAYFWLVDVISIQMWVSLLLGVLALTMAYVLKDTNLYLWVGLSSVVAGLAMAAILETQPWFSVDFFIWVGYILRFIDMPLVCLTILGFFDHVRFKPWMHYILWVYTGLAAVAIGISGTNMQLVSVAYLPMIVAAFIMLVCILRWTAQSRSATHGVVTVVFIGLVSLGVIDWVRFNYGGAISHPFLVPYGQSILSMVCFVALMVRVVQSLKVSRLHEQQLQEQVAEQTHALEVSQDRISGMEQTLLTLTKNIPVGTYVLEIDAQKVPKFTFVSDRWLNMLNLQREVVLADPGKGFACVHPEDFEAFMALNARVFAHIEPFTWVGRILVNHQVRWFSVESIPRKLRNGGAAWEGVMIDITATKEAEAALKLAHEKLTANEIIRSALEERERLLQDMHDGFGSQLSSASIMAEQGELGQQQLQQVLQECLQDLHLVINTLGGSGKTLEVVLGEFRFRTERRTSTLPTKIHWDFRLAGLPHLSERVILQICRILQEALTNALKHSQASNITVHGVYFASRRHLHLGVMDDGVGHSETMHYGNGIRSMQRRALNINALFFMSKTTPHTRVVLELTV
jgi:signal transduction histidine kinase